jgi:ribosomal-protein-alanine N-acetyltransferase
MPRIQQDGRRAREGNPPWPFPAGAPTAHERLLRQSNGLHDFALCSLSHAKVVDCCPPMEDLTIAAATDEERDWAAQLLAGSEPWIALQVTLEQCCEFCWAPEYHLFIARFKGCRCGAIVLHRRGVAGSPYIKSIAVAEEYRCHGIGAALMEFAENLFRNEARYIFLCVSSFNKRARVFYERHGYSAVGEIKDYVIEGASEILMHKRLQ